MDTRTQFDIYRIKRGRLSLARAAREMGLNPDHLQRVLDGVLPAGPKVRRKMLAWTGGEIDLEGNRPESAAA